MKTIIEILRVILWIAIALLVAEIAFIVGIRNLAVTAIVVLTVVTAIGNLILGFYYGTKENA